MARTGLAGIWCLAALALTIGMLFSCSVKPAVTVTDDDSGTKVEINKGEILAVKLAAQLGTGYGWKVVTESKELVLKGEPEQVSAKDQKPGGPDYQTFKFTAARRGETELKLHYIQAWQKDEKNPLKEFVITVIVK